MGIETVTGLGVSTIAGMQYFSTFLSSPWTVSKFTETEEDKEKVKYLFSLATLCTLLTAGAVAMLLKQIWVFLGALVLIAIYYWVYSKAMEGKI